MRELEKMQGEIREQEFDLNLLKQLKYLTYLLTTENRQFIAEYLFIFRKRGLNSFKYNFSKCLQLRNRYAKWYTLYWCICNNNPMEFDFQTSFTNIKLLH